MPKYLFLAFCALLSATSQAAIVRFSPPPLTVHVGDSFTLAILGSEFPDAVDGGGIDLSFNSAVLQTDNVTVNAIWEFLPSPGTIDNGGGIVDGIVFNTFVNSIKGSFLIGTVSFTAHGTGQSTIGISESALFQFASGGSLISPSFEGAQIVIASPVPLPGTAILLASCTIGILGFHKRYAKRPSSIV